MLFGLACIVAGGRAAALAMPALAPSVQPAAVNAAKDLTGTWQDTLHAGRDLRTVVKIAKAANGAYIAQFYSIDQGGQPLAVDTIILEGSTVKMALNLIGGKFEGKLSGDGKTIDSE